MSDLIEQAQDDLERLKERIGDGAAAGPSAQAERREGRTAAVVIAGLAACLAINEFQAKDAQTAFLAHHIAASDIWAQYQAKSIRRANDQNTAIILRSLPGADGDAIAVRAAEAARNAERMQSEPTRADGAPGDGMEQLAARAQAEEAVRDTSERRKTGLEIASGALQIAIVLASVSIVTGQRALLIAGGVGGVAAFVYGLLVSTGLT